MARATNNQDTARMLTRIRKAETSKKTKIWHDADLSREDGESLVRQMVLSLPAGHYKLHGREYGDNWGEDLYIAMAKRNVFETA